MLARAAVSIIRRAVSRFVAIGFCTCTCLPDAAAASTASRRKFGKVQTST